MGMGRSFLVLGTCCLKSDAMLLPRRADRTSWLVSAYRAESTALRPVRQEEAERLEPNASAAGVLGDRLPLRWLSARPSGSAVRS
jgi:hypothetical protein